MEKKHKTHEFFEDKLQSKTSDKHPRSVKPKKKKIQKFSFVKSARSKHPFVPMEKVRSTYIGFKLTSHRDKKKRVRKLPSNPMGGSRRPSYAYIKPVKEPSSSLWKPRDYEKAKVRHRNKEILEKEYGSFKKKKGR